MRHCFEALFNIATWPFQPFILLVTTVYYMCLPSSVGGIPAAASWRPVPSELQHERVACAARWEAIAIVHHRVSIIVKFLYHIKFNFL